MLSLLIGSAWAQTATQSTAEASGNALMQFLPLFLIFGVFYFLLIRPQQKQLDKHSTMIKALKKGDKIVTGGGIVGTISKTEGEEHLVVEIAKDVKVKVLRSTVSSLASDEGSSKEETTKE